MRGERRGFGARRYLERCVAMHGWKAPTQTSKPRKAPNCAPNWYTPQLEKSHHAGTAMHAHAVTQMATPIASTGKWRTSKLCTCGGGKAVA